MPARVERDSTQTLPLNGPNEGWEFVFYKEIDAVTRLSGQQELRKTALKTGEHEVRIWKGFGLSPLRGTILRYVDGQWAAIHVEADQYYEPTKVTRLELKPPHSGWDSMWKQLVADGLLKLPDASVIGCGEVGLDGFGVIIETHFENTYRTYMYPDPTLEQCFEAKQIVKIVDLILTEFEQDLRKLR